MIIPRYDDNHNFIPPTILLCHRNKSIIGHITPIDNFDMTVDMPQMNEFSFDVYKVVDGQTNLLWDEIIDLKLVYLKEYDEYFEIEVDKEVSNSSKKTICCKNLGIAETSNTTLYDIEINTESDIVNNDDYVRATVWNSDPSKQKTTILGRVLSKMPHYRVKHVDASLVNIFKTFSISESTVYDFLSKTLAEEIDCLSIIGSDRTISLYDLEDYCPNCGHREPDMSQCPECKNNNIKEGYGTNTSIYMSLNNLCEIIKVNTEKDKVKNTFRIAGGDEKMSATIRAVNPNGSEYIYMFSQDTYDDMSNELRNTLKSYISEYNKQKPIYSNLMKQVYDTLDEINRLESSMCPEPYPYTLQEEKAKIEKALHNQYVALLSIKNATKSNIENAIQGYAEALVDIGYTTSIRDDSSYNSSTKKWTGTIRISSIYADKEEAGNYIDTKVLTVNVNDNYETFTQQKLEKIASKKSAQEIYNIESDTDFVKELTKYNLSRLKSFSDAYEACLNVIIEMGSNSNNSEFKKVIYDKYKKRKKYIDSEISVRTKQIDTKKAQQDKLEKQCQQINAQLNIEKYLGTNLYYEFLAYRRDEKYQNDNYISEGLDNAELIKRAQELFEVAEKELTKACETQYIIETTIGNLFAIDEFKEWKNNFRIGAWMRIYDGDSIFKIRLLSYQIADKDFEKLPITLSNVVKISNGYSDIQSILNTAVSMSSSYDSIKRQVNDNSNTTNLVDIWTSKGIEAGIVPFSTNGNQDMVITENGLLGREYDDITETYSSEQLRIVNNTLAITDDNWETVKAAIGKVYYVDPNTQETVNAYGVLADVLIGKLILGEALQIVNSGGTLNFDNDGLLIRNAKNIFRVNPNNTNKLFSISKIENNKETDILYVDANGNGIFKGEIQSTSGHIANWKITSNELYYDSSNKSAGMSADGTHPSFWSGTTYANRANAPTRIMPDGKLYSTSAELTGDITTNNSIKIKNTSTSKTSTITNGQAYFGEYIEYVYKEDGESGIGARTLISSMPDNCLVLSPVDNNTLINGNVEMSGNLRSDKRISATSISSPKIVGAAGAFEALYVSSWGTEGKEIACITGGSTVLNITNKTTSVLLMDDVNYNKDIFFVTNGDGIANNVHMQGTTIQDGKCYVVFDRELSDTKIRVNWVRFTLA